MTPTVDDFHALARSSPWRWTTLHLRHRSRDVEVEAWLHRPDGLRIVDADGAPVPLSLAGQDPTGRPTGPWEPTHGDDGLFWRDYAWVAMLDPVELSHDVEVSDVRVGEWVGRPTWEARVRPLADYEPRCGCCSLLRSPIVDREEWGDRFVDHGYPDHHEVALDVQTGVVVRQHPVGGEEGGAWLENDILEVDT